MIKYKLMTICFAAILFSAPLSYADTVSLKNGGTVSGIIEKEDENNVEVNVGFGTVTFKKAQIKDIERSSVEDARKLAERWEAKRIELKAKEKEFEKARDNRFEKAYENWMDDLEAKKLLATGGSKQIDIIREPGGKGMMVEALLNNRVKANLILDTGASVIALSRKVGLSLGVDLSDTKKDIIQMHLADGNKTAAKMVNLDSVKVQDVEVKNVMAVIILDQATNVGVTDGLLGMSFLSKFNLKTDLKNMKMSLERIE